jgi:hypothetical protein
MSSVIYNLRLLRPRLPGKGPEQRTRFYRCAAQRGNLEERMVLRNHARLSDE